MPSIQINIGYFMELGSLPFPLMLVRLFLDGGWVIALIVLVYGLWLLWVQSRQIKYASKLTYTLLAIDIPRLNEQTPKAVEQIFSHLSGAYSGLDRFEKYWLGKFQPTFSFELVSVSGYVQFLVRCQTKFRDLVEAAVYAQYPDAEIVEVADYTNRVPTTYPHPEWDLFGTEYVLKKPYYYPIRTYVQFEHNLSEEYFKDPMSSVLEVMSSLRRGEELWLQILIIPTDDKWKEAGDAAANKLAGKKVVPKKTWVDTALEIPLGVVSELGNTIMGGGEEAPKEKKDDSLRMLALTPGERDTLEAMQTKLSKIGFLVKFRMVYVGRRDVFAKGRVASAVKGALGQFASLNMNQFKGYGPVTPKTDYFWQRRSAAAKQMALLRNFKNRSAAGAPPYILNIEELATVYHFPAMHVKAPMVKKTDAKRAEPPASLPTEESLRDRPFVRIKPPVEAAPPPEPEEEETDEAPGNLPFA